MVYCLWVSPSYSKILYETLVWEKFRVLYWHCFSLQFSSIAWHDMFTSCAHTIRHMYTHVHGEAPLSGHCCVHAIQYRHVHTCAWWSPSEWTLLCTCYTAHAIISTHMCMVEPLRVNTVVHMLYCTCYAVQACTHMCMMCMVEPFRLMWGPYVDTVRSRGDRVCTCPHICMVAPLCGHC